MQALSTITYRLPPLLKDLLTAIMIAVSFSAFIYFSHWDISMPLLESLLGLVALWALLTQHRRVLLFSGYLIGLLWFYWIGYSFEYNGVGWLTPIITIFFGFVYLLFFGVLSFTQKAWIRALLLFGLTFVEPFDFNWLQPELIFINSYFGIEKWQFALILAVLALFIMLKERWRYVVLFLLAGAIAFPAPARELPTLKIDLIATDLPQEEKWLPHKRREFIQQNLDAIDKSIEEGHDIVVLPESAFPLYLNHAPDLTNQLLMRSFNITIITGALFEENKQNYNVTYQFTDGRYTIAKKMTLVPFGEYVPLPKFAQEWVNKTFFAGSSDYISATEPTDLIVGDTTFRNAVCYEATCEEIYEGDPDFMIAISNNAWFTPSIEPTLQRLLMRYYAKKHDTIIFHAANSDGTGIVRP